VKSTHTISLAGGKHSWEDVDERARSLGLARSEYIQNLVDADFDNSKKKIYPSLWEIIVLLILAVLTLMISTLIMR